MENGSRVATPPLRPLSRSAPGGISPTTAMDRMALRLSASDPLAYVGAYQKRRARDREDTGSSQSTLGELAQQAGVRPSNSMPGNVDRPTNLDSVGPTAAFEEAIEENTGAADGGRVLLETPGGNKAIVESPGEALIEQAQASLSNPGPRAGSGDTLLQPQPTRPQLITSTASSSARPSPENGSDPSPTPSSFKPASQATVPSFQSQSPRLASPPYGQGQWPQSAPAPFAQQPYPNRYYAPQYAYPPAGFAAPGSPGPNSLGLAPNSPPTSQQQMPPQFGAQPYMYSPMTAPQLFYYDQYGRAVPYSAPFDQSGYSDPTASPVSPQQPALYPSFGVNADMYASQQSQPGFQSYMPLQQSSPMPPLSYPGPAMRMPGPSYERAMPMQQQGGERRGGKRNVMPRPPAHSEYAMWVGNVPSDSNHAELWRFFTTRPPPPPSAVAHDPSLAELLATPGVESIHLISRSNCAFVNYSSAPHLEHAIRVCHNVPLRPGDPRTMGKDLVCRIRRKDDDTKTGVGAQRAPGQRVHHQWVQQQEQQHGVGAIGGAPSSIGSIDEPVEPPFSSNASQDRSGSTASTTSSFLNRHFPKRFFILKSHTEDDLELSVERSLWATQSHNEPVLDQAFRTSRDGVYLIFSANRTGAFFGYARMTGAIFTDEQRQASRESIRTEQRSHSPIIELDEAEPQSAVTDRFGVASPQPATPGVVASPSPMPNSVSDPQPFVVLGGGSAPAPNQRAAIAAAQQRAETLDPKALRAMRIHDQPAPDRLEVSAEDVSHWRSASLSAEERNARLEHLDSVDAGQNQTGPIAGAATGRGRPFMLEWIKVQRLSFQRTKHLRNPFNLNREIKVSRDGTELEPNVGEALLAAFELAETGPPTPPISAPLSPRTSAPTSPRSPFQHMQMSPPLRGYNRAAAMPYPSSPIVLPPRLR